MNRLLNLKVIFLLLGSGVFSNVLLAQEQLYTMPLGWKLGDVRIVHGQSTSQVWMSDTLLMNSDVTSTYRIEVIDTTGSYTLKYAETTEAPSISLTSTNRKVSSIQDLFKAALKDIEEEATTFEYAFLIDKQSGLAYELRNSDEYVLYMEDLILKLMDGLYKEVNRIAVEKGKRKIPIDSLKKILLPKFKAAHPKMIQTAINEVNLLLQAYSYEFSLDGSVSQEMLIYPLNTVREDADLEYPATQTIKSKEKDGKLIIQSSLDYDKEFMLEQMKKKTEHLDDVRLSDIILEERAEIVFNTETTWIKSYTHNVLLELPNIKTVNVTKLRYSIPMN